MLIGVDASRAVVAQRTGTEVYSLHLIRELLEIDSAHRLRLYLNTAPPRGLLPEPAHCEQRVMPFPRLWTHVRLSAEMLSHPPDVLFVPSHVLPLIHPRRSVVTVHDLGHRTYPQAHTRKQRWYLEWSTRYHLRTAAHILADSGSTKEDLVRLYGADPARITVAYLGVDPAMQPVRDLDRIAAVKHRVGIEGPYLLYVGTLQPRKNLPRLIEAFSRSGERGISSDGERLQLVLAGKRGWLAEDLRSQAQKLGIGGQVVTPGFVDDADLATLYSGATLFVMPSLYEGFCMPVLEAMACGTPVACSDVSSLPEVAGDAALMFDPHDVVGMARQMDRGVYDVSLRAALIAQGLARARRFTWRACAHQVLEVLERVGQEGRSWKA